MIIKIKRWSEFCQRVREWLYGKDQAATEEQVVKSTHRVDIVPVVLEKHDNADALSVVQVFGYTCCVRTADWQGIPLAAYIPPDSSVDARRPEFAFLAADAKEDGSVRIKARKLRGVVSFGLLIPAPPGTTVGEDVAARLGVTHYEPPIKGEGGTNRQSLYMGGEVATGPDVFTVKYDVDAFRRYNYLFSLCETVIVTEKLDGASAKYVYKDGKMHCSSRTEWKKEYPSYDHVTVESLVAREVPEEKAREIVDRLLSKPKKRNMWWEILSRTPTLEKFCQDNPGVVVYGEVFGNVGRIKYAGPDGFAAFDVMKDGRWVDGLVARDMLLKAEVPCVPLVGTIPYDFNKICELAEGQSLYDPKAIREGIVVKPVIERRDRHVGRVQFKCVSAAYLEKY
jgi:RNA ligase (TIGR02306 family)